MMILHISDLHFGTEQGAVVDALLRSVEDLTLDAVIVSGDITQRARRREFAAALAFLDELCERAALSLREDVLLVPGNHDIPLFNLAARLGWPYHNYTRAFGPTLQPVLRRDGLLAIGVNTTRRWRHKHGQISQQQIDAVSAGLRAAGDDTLRIVVTHQPLAVKHADDEIDLLRGHAAARSEWLAAGVDLVLAGHIHLAYALPLEGESPRGGGWLLQTGTAVSERVRDQVPNSFHVIMPTPLAATRCVIERFDYHWAEDAFLAVERVNIPRVR